MEVPRNVHITFVCQVLIPPHYTECFLKTKVSFPGQQTTIGMHILLSNTAFCIQFLFVSVSILALLAKMLVVCLSFGMTSYGCDNELWIDIPRHLSTRICIGGWWLCICIVLMLWRHWFMSRKDDFLWQRNYLYNYFLGLFGDFFFFVWLSVSEAVWMM